MSRPIQIFAVYDKKTEAHLQPFFLQTNAAAIRMFEKECKNQESPFCQYPADYTLLSIGQYDEITGVITSTQPNILANASEFKH